MSEFLRQTDALISALASESSDIDKPRDHDAQGQELPPFSVYENFSPESRVYSVIAREVLAEVARRLSLGEMLGAADLTGYDKAIYAAASNFIEAVRFKTASGT